MGAARYVGRVGGLAVALGVGVAVFLGNGIAYADSDGDSDAGSGGASSNSQDGSGPTESGAAKDSAAGSHPNAGGSEAGGKDPSSTGRGSGTAAKSGSVVATGGANTKVRTVRLAGSLDGRRTGESKRPPRRVAKPRLTVESNQNPAGSDPTGSDPTGSDPTVHEQVSGRHGGNEDEDEGSLKQQEESTESGITTTLTSLDNDVNTVLDASSTSHTGYDPTSPVKDSATALLAAAARREIDQNAGAYTDAAVVDGVITGYATAGSSAWYTVTGAPINGGKVTINKDTNTYTFLPDASQLKEGGTDQFKVLVSHPSPLVQLLEGIPGLKDFVRPIVVALQRIPILGFLLSPIIGTASESRIKVPVGAIMGDDPIAFTTKISSFDGTKISVNYFPQSHFADDPDGKAPTILNGPSLATAGYTDPSQQTTVFGLVPGLAMLRQGYNVVTWDPRGEFSSGGRLHLDSENFEARDVSAIIDWVAKLPTSAAEVNDPNDPNDDDPLIGMVGGSYGGGIQLTSAGIDKRIDAISPGIAWNDLTTTLYPHDAFKTAWSSLLLLSLVASGSRLDPEIYSGILTGVISGRLTEKQQEFLNSNSPYTVASQIAIPTLFLQGTVDTLFPLEQALQNAEQIVKPGIPMKMIWYCGGHGQCLDPVDLDQQTTYTTGEIMAWMDRYVMHKEDPLPADTEDPFTWVDQDGDWWGSPYLPIDQDNFYGADYDVPGSTSGLLPIVPVFGGSGPQNLAKFPVSLVSGAEVTHGALNLTVVSPTTSDGSDPTTTYVVGAPTLTLEYSGLGNSRDIYAQLVDNTTHRVLGNIVSPIPVKLDGTKQTVTVDMENIAYTMEPGDTLTLQIFDSATSFENFTSFGLVNVTSVKLTLPTAADVDELVMDDDLVDAD